MKKSVCEISATIYEDGTAEVSVQSRDGVAPACLLHRMIGLYIDRDIQAGSTATSHTSQAKLTSSELNRIARGEDKPS